MTDPSFISDDAFLKIKTIRRLRKVLQKERWGYIRVLHARCGVGLTVEEFDTIVKGLAPWCFLKEGGQGALKVVFNEQFQNVNVPSDAEAQ